MTIYSRCVLRVHWPCILAVTVYSNLELGETEDCMAEAVCK